MAKGRNFVFPNPENTKLKDNAVFCSNERIIALYNQANDTDRKRMTDNIKHWFASEAQENGWAGGNYLRDSQTGHSAGCVLFTPSKETNIHITKNTLVLHVDNEDA
ncbi:hypothetical protein [Vibrio gazogenes]|uniref:Uncharacterized protein n=1 Tax=Vibrio gazogenes DSM 21264 = NBRC 103151 TaxID=1123492 RepID=A0A1M5GVP9_VIBGA|nr:hypothetical protein [Vibrio gazogenes]USP15807.1 hypothetical protein MKS89_20725 [Vibrio gazogenes]SHG07834.1 hypothetical protein SAMN02745781_03911 [Vibrio gazogenes DSM 21264] [Vibrio gazogenes DSM 21264 = NBRC 103151]SJN56821.1 hypothetical protein BQ6471_02229 [Vibrio gazogenes]